MIKLFISAFLLFYCFAYSQVGIDTSDPKATLDVAAKPTDILFPDGIIAPRLTGNELKTKDNAYGSDQNGTIIFVTSAASPTTSKTEEVIKSGYYYYNNDTARWTGFHSSAGNGVNTNSMTNVGNSLTSTVNGIAASTSTVNAVSNTLSASNQLTTTVNGVSSTPLTLSNTNIYTNNGTLTANRTVMLDSKSLHFQDSTGDIEFDDSSIYQTSNGASVKHELQAGASPNNGTIAVQIISGTQATIQASNGSDALVIRTQSTNVSAPIRFNTSSGGGASAQNRAEIAGDGRFNINQSLSVGYSGQQTFTGTQKLKVNGSIVTTGATYPDYVFEKYFTGNSQIKPDYLFNKLEDTKNFVEKNHHLPGIVSIKDLQKSEGGYDFDLTQLSIQQLEKIEELYLHLFEQSEIIKKQQSENLDLKIRLEKLEKRF